MLLKITDGHFCALLFDFQTAMPMQHNTSIFRIWTLIKTNWFSTALIILLLLAVGRNRLPFHWSDNPTTHPKNSPEKLTENGTAATENKSLFGLIPGTNEPQAAIPAVDEATTIMFLRRFGKTATGEHKKFGTPASVLLAIAYVNSAGGQRETVTKANNYFALRCNGNWDGAMATIDRVCVRQYNTPWESFRDFSITLAGQDWYGEVRQSAGKDWTLWVKALGDKNLSDVPNFEAELSRVIQAYRLFELDTP